MGETTNYGLKLHDDPQETFKQFREDINENLQKIDTILHNKQEGEGDALNPIIGTICYIASEDVDETWLKCDGSFINEKDYPELVEKLGKLTPSNDKFKLISNGEVGTGISNGVLYDGRLWVYSWATAKLYGIDTEGEQLIKTISINSSDPGFSGLHIPSQTSPLCLSIVSDYAGGYKIFLAQEPSTVLGGAMDANASSITLEKPFSTASVTINQNAYPRIISAQQAGSTVYCMATNGYITNASKPAQYCEWQYGGSLKSNNLVSGYPSTRYDTLLPFARSGFNPKNQNEFVAFHCAPDDYFNHFGIASKLHGLFRRNLSFDSKNFVSTKTHYTTMPVMNDIHAILKGSVTNGKLCLDILNGATTDSLIGLELDLSLPSAAKTFTDATCYLWDKDIFMIFVGTGIVFSRTLEPGSFGYLDTTSVLGTITQHAYLDYSQDDGTLYIVGQDSSNHIKCAKIVLNTLYDYANDGAWLPLIVADGIPAYIKALGEIPIHDVNINLTITEENAAGYPLLSSIYSFTIADKIPVSQQPYPMPGGDVKIRLTALQTYTNNLSTDIGFSVSVSGELDGVTPIIGTVIQKGATVERGDMIEAEFNFEPYGEKNTSITYKTYAAS